MKKFLAIALAIVMMAALAVPAFAEYTQTDVAGNTVNGTDEHYGKGNDTPTTNPSNDNYLEDQESYIHGDTTLIKYGVAQAYIVTIPAEINLHEHKDSANTSKTVGYVYGIESIGVYDVVIAGDEDLNIYITSQQFNAAQDVNAWELIDREVSNVYAEGQDGPSANVNYKIVVDPTTVDYAADETNYLTKDTYGTATNVVVSGNGESTLVGHVLNCPVQTGNIGTTGSEAYANLYFSSKGTAQEGTYTDTLTFHVRIEAGTKYEPAAPNT